jgi:DNA-binding transcriptional LysR family regulator
MDLYGIDLNLLVAFDALMAERSVTRAGARLGRTQPAMSAALARLRALLKDELFVRGPEGLQPTPRALDLAGPIGQALAEIQRTLDFTQSFEPASSPASFTLGLPDHPAFLLLPRLVGALRQAAPLASLRIRSFTARDEALQLLEAGEVDATIGVPVSGATGGRILSLPLFEERFVCIVRKGHPAAQAPLTMESYIGLSHLLVSPENERYGLVDAALARIGLKRTLSLTLQQMYVAPRLVATSDLVATLMEGVVVASGVADELVILEPPLTLPRVPFLLSWHRRNDAHPAQRWFREVVAHLSGQKGGDESPTRCG